MKKASQVNFSNKSINFFFFLNHPCPPSRGLDLVFDLRTLCVGQMRMSILRNVDTGRSKFRLCDLTSGFSQNSVAYIWTSNSKELLFSNRVTGTVFFPCILTPPVCRGSPTHTHTHR